MSNRMTIKKSKSIGDEKTDDEDRGLVTDRTSD